MKNQKWTKYKILIISSKKAKNLPSTTMQKIK